MDLQQEQACWKLELDKVTKLDPSKKKKKKKKKKPFIREDATYDSEPDYGYAELLSRVFDMLRVEVSTERPRTVMMRRPQLLPQEGTHITVCLDFAHLCTTMHRKPGHVIKFLLDQMETKGWLNKQHHLEIKGLVSSQHFQAVFHRYIDAFVICSCCKSPDTALAEDNGISTLSCEMCGLVALINEPNPL